MVEIFETYRRMLQDAGWIFDETSKAILEHGDLSALRPAVARRIEELDRSELEIRRKIVTHLVVSEGQEVGTCLVIFRNAHDVTRLGGLCRDLEDIMTLGREVVFPEPFDARIPTIFAALGTQMKTLIEAVNTSDMDAVTNIVRTLEGIGNECGALIGSLMEERSVEVLPAVETAMTLRLSKRIARYLTNIAKGVAADPQQLD